ncbi:hypothetical protein F5Y19DRAFT_442287 [Xylariaceae sp. FL1651]|nr:hypothetical protein F5Y19DRAFT_442287 [Xylariaceae sp. FL1651]
MDDRFQFIITTPARLSIDTKRKSIRSHVMQGKNQKKRPLRPPSWIGRRLPDEIVPSVLGRPLTVPNKIGGEASCTSLPAEISLEMLETLRKLKWATGPPNLGQKIEIVYHQSERSWFEPIKNDPACLHLTMFVAKAYQDSITYGKQQEISSLTALASFGKALNLLQQRLLGSDSEASTSESTILVVTGLTMTATALGELETASKHLKGLHKMVMLRGGLLALGGNKQLQTKICRADLSVALSVGCNTLFFSEDGISWDAYLASQKNTTFSNFQNPDLEPASNPESIPLTLQRFIHRLDERLCRVWYDVSEVIGAINIAGQCKRSIDYVLYQEAMISVHYRLVNLKFAPDGANESIRLALLGFCSGVFLQWRAVKFHYKNLAQQLKRSLRQSDLQGEVFVPDYVALWQLIIAIVSVFDEQEKDAFQRTLARVIGAMGLKSWIEVKSAVKSVLWVEALHDAPAKSLIEAALAVG